MPPPSWNFGYTPDAGSPGYPSISTLGVRAAVGGIRVRSYRGRTFANGLLAVRVASMKRSPGLSVRFFNVTAATDAAGLAIDRQNRERPTCGSGAIAFTRGVGLASARRCGRMGKSDLFVRN
jgi:hypothetical protein